ncbi:hypothetical protein Mapa_015337 [Marchantia paleacea]|nr:hypothetical protein Mapa_015337 [Marchantia paleacea]
MPTLGSLFSLLPTQNKQYSTSHFSIWLVTTAQQTILQGEMHRLKHQTQFLTQTTKVIVPLPLTAVLPPHFRHESLVLGLHCISLLPTGPRSCIGSPGWRYSTCTGWGRWWRRWGRSTGWWWWWGRIVARILRHGRITRISHCNTGCWWSSSRTWCCCSWDSGHAKSLWSSWGPAFH